MISLTNHDSSEGEQWGRYNLPRYIIYIYHTWILWDIQHYIAIDLWSSVHTSPNPSHPPGSPRSPGAVMLPGIRGGLIIKKGGCIYIYICKIQFIYRYVYNMCIYIYIYVKMYIMHIWICGNMMNYPWKNTFKHQEQGMQQTNGNLQPSVLSPSGLKQIPILLQCQNHSDHLTCIHNTAHQPPIHQSVPVLVGLTTWKDASHCIHLKGFTGYMMVYVLVWKNTHNKSWFNIT